MQYNFLFFFNTILLGVGLAMDAFSVSLANGLQEKKMSVGKINCVAGTFGVFQTLMPLIGWVCVHTIAEKFVQFKKFIPWIALILLLYIGGKMLLEGLKSNGEIEEVQSLTFSTLIIQAIATSIDALSVGFTISDYDFLMALVATVIIGIVTYGICVAGILLGKKFATKLAGKASILGGLILILIGIEIFVKGVF